MGVDRTLPREEFFYRQLVSSADFLKAYQASAYSVDDYGLAPGHPAFFVSGGGNWTALDAISPPNKLFSFMEGVTCARNRREQLNKRKILKD